MQLRMPRLLIAVALAAIIGGGMVGIAMVGPAHGSSEPVAARAVSATPLLRAHAHNDYLNSPPVTGALGHGFTSLEADVWLRKDPDGVTRLRLCHMYKGDVCYDDESHSLPGTLPFKETYLDGLQAWVNAHGGRIYPGYDKPIYLLVEIKCNEGKDSNGASVCMEEDGASPGAASFNNPLKVLAQIKTELQDYRQMLYSPSNLTGPVQVVITGGHNGQEYNDPTGQVPMTSVRDTLLGGDPSYDAIYLDGDLGTDYSHRNARIPLVNFTYPATNGCGINEGAMLNPPVSPPRTTTGTVDEILDAHANGHQVRAWNLPDCPARGGADDPAYAKAREEAWEDAKLAGVDYLSSNHLQYLGDWLLAHYNEPAQGGGACDPPQAIPPGVHHGYLPSVQYCTVWTANVPVRTSRDPNSPVVGYLVVGGRANWFLGQTQGCEFTYPGKTWSNDWWAYTEADDGRWGWTSVVYFSGGGNDQPADGLGSYPDANTTTCLP